MSSNKRIIQDLKTGNDEAIATVAKSFFPSSRKFLRLKGVRDTMTPAAFATAFVKIFTDIRRGKISELSDFGNLLNNALIMESATAKGSPADAAPVNMTELQADVAAQCVAVLDEQARKLLYLRYAERMTFEEIAAEFNFSNPVIAQFETEKAYRQLEGIVKVRFNLGQN